MRKSDILKKNQEFHITSNGVSKDNSSLICQLLKCLSVNEQLQLQSRYILFSSIKFLLRERDIKVTGFYFQLLFFPYTKACLEKQSRLLHHFIEVQTSQKSSSVYCLRVIPLHTTGINHLLHCAQKNHSWISPQLLKLFYDKMLITFTSLRGESLIITDL